jgi:hypothetical protein
MIRQVTTALKQHYREHKYSGGFMSRVAYGPDTPQYDTQIVEEQIPSPAPSLNGNLTIRRRYHSKVPILKPANWRIFHELHDVHRIMQQLKIQQGYSKSILSILKKITVSYHNHNQTAHLVAKFLSKPTITKAIQRTPPIPIHPRSEQFNPLQVVIGTLVARKIIHPESNTFYEPHINRATLTPNGLSDEELKKAGSSMLPIDKKYIRKEEYKRHYKLDPDHWYMYWPKSRHTSKHQSIQRFIYTISENEHWSIPAEYYQKQTPTTWTSAPPPNPTAVVDNELIEREKFAATIYHQFFQLTH